jgi:3'(2'), 5'-bisphosphate nucleotidase
MTRDISPDEAAALMPELTAIVARACAAILRLGVAPHRAKADGSPVTDADEASEAILLDGLAALLPGLPVVAEESVARGQRVDIGSTFALVDPLDGTREYIAGRDEYTVNIALIAATTPVAGVVAAPARGRLWRGVVGRGAERLRIEGERALTPEPIHSRVWPASGAIALVSRSHPDAATEALIQKLAPSAIESCGSSLKFCRVAEGSADIYPRLGPTSEWDIAAGHALLVAAGGAVTRQDTRPLAYGRTDQKFLVPGFAAWGDPARAQAI